MVNQRKDPCPQEANSLVRKRNIKLIMVVYQNKMRKTSFQPEILLVEIHLSHIHVMEIYTRKSIATLFVAVKTSISKIKKE